MAQIIWTDPALLELDEIGEYIDLDKYSAAKIYIIYVMPR